MEEVFRRESTAHVFGPSGSSGTSESVRSDLTEINSSKLSIVMSVYNGERFVAEAIESVLSQTFTEFEFVIVDDGSTDRSSQIINEYKARDPRIVLISQENSGISASLNRGLMEAKNDLVAHIDHDDRALPNWLERQLAFWRQHSECSVVSSFAYFINTSGKRFGVSRNLVDVEKGRRELNPSLFLELIHSSVLMRKKDVLAVGGYRPITTEDRDLWGRVVTAGMMIRCNPKPLVEYRLHGSSETTRKLNTVETFARRGIDMNIVRRLKGERELTAEEVEQWYRSRPATEKVKEFRRVCAGVNFRRAARHYSEGKWLSLMYAFGLATLMRPIYVLTRAFNKVGVRSS